MQQRRLAAIMFTDIVGYASMMEKDEKKAFDHLKKNRRIHYRLIRKYRGRWLKEMGDGILASFTSNIDAVMCAVSIQKSAEEMNIPLRIGIHQGDVIFEKKDVLGDGVNIASRIQGIANTNGIVISEKVYSDIKNKEGLETVFLGARTLKGVESSFGIYKVYCQDNSLLDYTIDTGELIRPLGFGKIPIVAGIMITALLAYAGYYFLPRIINPPSELGKSVLVLPFDNYTGSDTLEYFVAGMHSSLIGDIGKISALRVISKTTSNTYKDVEKSIPEIASELSVGAVIEASVLCLGDSVCLQVKLVSVYPEEQQLWIKDFYVEKSQILNLYNRVTKEISEKINVILTPHEETMLAESRFVDPEAYDAYQKGQFFWDQLGENALQWAMEYYNIAIEKDPDWAPPYTGLAEVWIGRMQMGLVTPSIAIPKIHENISKALELDPNSSNSHYVNATIAVWTEWDWEKGEKEFLKALELNPSHTLGRVLYAHLLMILGRSDEALYQGNQAVKLDPLKPLVLALHGIVMIDAGEYQSAITLAEKALSIEPNHSFAKNSTLEFAYYFNGDYVKSFEILKQSFEGEVLSTIEKNFDEQGYFAALKEIMILGEEAAQEEYIHPYYFANLYSRVKNYNKALEWLEKGYEIHDPNMPYITAVIHDFNQMKDNPRFIDILKKMKLPLE